MADKHGPGRRGYAADFRQRVLAKLASGEAPLRQVAEEFSVSVPTLIKWRKEGQRAKPPRATAEPLPKAQPAHASELQRLRHEVEQLKEERERLRRSIAILAGVEYKATS